MFSLRNQHGETVELKTLAGGPVLMMFYPFAFSRVCGVELAEVRTRWAEFEQLETRVLAISCDAVHTLRAYADQLGSGTTAAEPVGLELLSDFWPHGAAALRYGAFNPLTGGAQRVSFLLDSELRIRHRIAAADGEPRSIDQTLELLGSL